MLSRSLEARRTPGEPAREERVRLAELDRLKNWQSQSQNYASFREDGLTRKEWNVEDN
jgi:hypothetical protein